MRKRIAVVRAPEDVDRVSFVADLLASSRDADVFVTEPDPRRATAIVCGGAAQPAGIVLATYSVEEHVMWDEPIDGPVHSMFAFFRPPDGLAHDAFVERYRAHADLARVHHPGIRRYVQDLVVEQSGEERWTFAAISELHFAGPDSYSADFYRDDESRDVIARDVVRFSDGPSAKMIVAVRVER